MRASETRSRKQGDETMKTAAKNAAISQMILANVAAGMSIAEALDAVLGTGSHAAIVSDIYEALRA